MGISSIGIGISVGTVATVGIRISMSVSVSVSVGVWMVSGISVPGLWISLSLGFCFSLDHMNCSTAVSVVCVWFYDGMVVNIWSIVISIWIMVVWSCTTAFFSSTAGAS